MGALIKAIKAHNKPLGIDYIAKGGATLLANLRINRDFCLYSDNIEIERQIAEKSIKNLSDYGSIIIYGCRLRSMKGGANWFHHIKKTNFFYSKALTSQIMDEFIMDNVHYQFLAKNRATISTLRNTRFTSMPCPMPNELMPACSRWQLSNKRVEITNHEIEARLNNLSVYYLNTPEELLNSDRVATQAKFKNLRDGDFSHLNDKGGEMNRC